MKIWDTVSVSVSAAIRERQDVRAEVRSNTVSIVGRALIAEATVIDGLRRSIGHGSVIAQSVARRSIRSAVLGVQVLVRCRLVVIV